MLNELQDSYLSQVPKLEKGASAEQVKNRRETVKTLSESFFEEACARLDLVSSDAFPTTSWCYRCEKQCSVFPELQTGEQGDIWLEIAGNTCTPWSRAGSELGWLDRASLPALAWGYWLRRGHPHFIVNECTPAWPAKDFFARIMPQQYRLGSISVSPEDLGIPSRRPRLYTTCASTTTTSLIAMHDKLFMSVLRRRVVLDADAFFCAPVEVQQRCLEDLLRVRGHGPPPQGATGVQWTVAFTFSERQRLSGYRKMFKERTATGFLCNISQNSSFVARLHNLMPCLLKNSMLYNLQTKRLLCSPELFCVNGVPLFADIDDKDELMVVPPEVFCRMKYRAAQQLAGNMMNIPVVGSVVGMLLLCTATCTMPPTEDPSGEPGDSGDGEPSESKA